LGTEHEGNRHAGPMEESPYPRYLPSAVTTTHELAFVSLVVSTEQQYSNRLFASCPWHNIVALNTTRKKTVN